MGTDKFSWKSLFVNEDATTGEEVSKTGKVEKEVVNKFPEVSESARAERTFPENQKSFEVNKEVLDSVLQMYEKGFDSLNLPGYDFYEFFKAIMAVDPDSASAYTMAFTMARSMDGKLSKELLLEKAAYYISEIDKVHKNYEAQGKKKKEDILDAQSKEKSSLENEVLQIEIHIKKLQQDLTEKKSLLEKVDSKYTHSIVEIEEKLTANNISKNTIEGAIGRVVNGIKNHLN